jgi:hypothetical protein
MSKKKETRILKVNIVKDLETFALEETIPLSIIESYLNHNNYDIVVEVEKPVSLSRNEKHVILRQRFYEYDLTPKEVLDFVSQYESYSENRIKVYIARSKT